MRTSSEQGATPIAPEKVTALRRERARVLARFSEYLRRESSAARAVDTSILVDTLPSWLDAVVDALVTAKPERDLLETTAREHGEHRATTLREYTVHDLLKEYIILRRVVFETLEADGPLAIPEREFLIELFEEDALHAVSGFLQIHASRSQGFIAKAEEAGNVLAQMLSESSEGVAAIDHGWRFIYMNREAARVLSGGLHSTIVRFWSCPTVRPRCFVLAIHSLPRRRTTRRFSPLLRTRVMRRCWRRRASAA